MQKLRGSFKEGSRLKGRTTHVKMLPLEAPELVFRRAHGITLKGKGKEVVLRMSLTEKATVRGYREIAGLHSHESLSYL